jgi:hypothetical protein
MTTIDLTPTRSEHARITAYILASHLKGSPYTFGDYWNYTPDEENAIFATWNALEDIHATYQLAGLSFYEDCPKAHKAKLIEATFKGALAQVIATREAGFQDW